MESERIDALLKDFEARVDTHDREQLKARALPR